MPLAVVLLLASVAVTYICCPPDDTISYGEVWDIVYPVPQAPPAVVKYNLEEVARARSPALKIRAV